MGLLQDPNLRSGLKSAVRFILAKFRIVGSNLSLVKIRKNVHKTAFLLVIFALVIIPIYAQASIVSFIFNLFSSEKVEAEEIVPNSQNMPLLQAEISPLYGTTTEVTLSIVDGTSLSATTQFSQAEIKSYEDGQISIYVVREGDTLPAIAKMFDVSVNTIRWANDISGNTIKVSQTLVILPISGIKHIVKSGDTLQGIAKQHKGDLNEILQYNNLTIGSKLSIGDVVIVPDGEAAPTSTTRPSVNSSSARPTYNGYYLRPIVGGVKSQGLHGYNGVDLAGSYGANILASADGEVIISRSGWNGGYGTYVVIKHGNGTQTLYGHLSSTLVSAGSRVSQGQVIGRMGSTGKSTGVHLHFEIRGARNPF